MKLKPSVGMATLEHGVDVGFAKLHLTVLTLRKKPKIMRI
jgi:hypothetical protein